MKRVGKKRKKTKHVGHFAANLRVSHLLFFLARLRDALGFPPVEVDMEGFRGEFEKVAGASV